MKRKKDESDFFGVYVKKMATPSDPRLYAQVKREAKRRFERWPSAYASGWLVREYKRRGGEFVGKRGHGVGRWFKERWVQVIPYILNSEIVECGAGDRSKACRPLRRVDEDTPVTIGELTRKHGRAKVLALALQKSADMSGRVYWSRGAFYPSK